MLVHLGAAGIWVAPPFVYICDMKLIADSGSTKTVWAVLDGTSVDTFETLGYNPSFMSFEEIAKDIAASFPEGFPYGQVSEVWFYCAGVTPVQEEPARKMLAGVFCETLPENIHATSDTLGACRALLGDKPGFAAILGTGMNTCLYDGKDIGFKLPALGFMLGDEGGGAYIGKKYIVDYLRGNMPEKVAEVAAEAIGMDMQGIIEQVYRKPAPNRWCAGFTKVVADHFEEDGYYWDLVRGAVDDFFWNVVSRYPDYTQFEFNCVGSVGYGFRDVIELIASQYRMRMGRIIKSPIEGLIEYHSKN